LSPERVLTLHLINIVYSYLQSQQFAYLCVKIKDPSCFLFRYDGTGRSASSLLHSDLLGQYRTKKPGSLDTQDFPAYQGIP
jgi:hypothetical protein